MDTLEHNVEAAATSADDIRWFRGYLRGLLDGGLEQPTLESVLETVYKHLRDEGNERASDLVLDGLDVVTGWCGPDMAVRDSSAA